MTAFQHLDKVYQIHKAFASILELDGYPEVARDTNLKSYMILSNVTDNFKVAILNTKQLRKILFSFLKYYKIVIYLLKLCFSLNYQLFKNYLIAVMNTEGESVDLESIRYGI